MSKTSNQMYAIERVTENREGKTVRSLWRNRDDEIMIFLSRDDVASYMDNYGINTRNTETSYFRVIPVAGWSLSSRVSISLD